MPHPEVLTLRTFFALLAVGLGALSLSDAALSYDGSYLLFRALEAGRPWVDHGRLTHVILQMAPAAASHLTHRLPVLVVLFGLSCASVPLLALAASWWIVRRQAPSLFVWGALGILLAALPGQFCLVADMVIVAQMAWPLWLGALVGIERGTVWLILCIAVLVAFSHPIGVVVLGTAAALSVGTELRRRDVRQRRWTWALAFSAMTLVALGYAVCGADPYETALLTPATLAATFRSSVAGWPLVAVLAAWLAGALIFAARALATRRRRPRRLAELAAAGAFVSLAAAGAAMLVWGVDSHRWIGAIGFRMWALPCAGPFLVAALVERLRVQAPASSSRDSGDAWARRRAYANLVAAIWSATLVAQGYTWLGLTARLRHTVTSEPATCQSLDAPAYRWAYNTALWHYSISTLSLVVQGPRPSAVVLPAGMCEKTDRHAGLYMADWYTQSWNTRWFDLASLRPER